MRFIAIKTIKTVGERNHRVCNIRVKLCVNVVLREVCELNSGCNTQIKLRLFKCDL